MWTLELRLLLNWPMSEVRNIDKGTFQCTQGGQWHTYGVQCDQVWLEPVPFVFKNVGMLLVDFLA
jgi:hypothetical protein